MTTSDRFEQRVASWLQHDAKGHVAEHLDVVLAITAATPQRRTWQLGGLVLARETVRTGIALGAAVLALAGIVVLSVGTPRPLPGPTASPPSAKALTGTMVVSRDGDLYLVDADGSNLRAAVVGPGFDDSVAFSRDGTRFAFVRQHTVGDDEVFIANADGSDARPAVSMPHADVIGYAWSPDGSELAVVRRIDDRYELSIVSSTDPRTWRDVPVADFRAIGPSGFGFAIAWRGSGAGELLLTGAWRSQQPGVYAVSLDGTNVREVLFGVVSQYIELSHDGRRLAYFVYDAPPGGPALRTAAVHVVDVDTGDDRVLSTGSSWEEELHFSPDGTTGAMIVCADQTAPCDLVVVSLDGSIATRSVGTIHGPTPKERHILYSPDGRWIIAVQSSSASMQTDTTLIDVRSGASAPIDWGFPVAWGFTVEAWVATPKP